MKKQIIVMTLVLLLFIFSMAGCQEQKKPEPKTNDIPDPPVDEDMTITSSAFENGGEIPITYTLDGENYSPPLTFSHVPEEAESLVLIMDDPDAGEEPWVHWLVYDIPTTVTGFSENEFFEYPQGETTGGLYMYEGPAPPIGESHRYYFRLYALDTLLNLEDFITRAELEQAMSGHIIEEALLMGTYTA